MAVSGSSNFELNVAEIMVHSSNIGSALMAEEFGAVIQKEYMKRLGLLDRLPLELPEIAKPLSPKHWKRAATLTVSYGHGISISPTHLASAVSTASSNGLRAHGHRDTLTRAYPACRLTHARTAPARRGDAACTRLDIT